MMRRRLWIAASLLVSLPIPLAPANHAVLTGDSALLSDTHGQAVDVTRVPLAGGAATSGAGS